jgi:glycosyltransferase involved in cell wall biosynthesis
METRNADLQKKQLHLSDGRPIPERKLPIELSLVMPCFNEAYGIENLVKQWATLLQKEVGSFEIIIINDGSKDGSGRILDKLRKEIPELRIIHQLNFGKNRALRRGYELARGNFILQTDSNGRYEPEDFIPMWQARNQAPIIVAQRTHRLDPLPRRICSHFLKKTLKSLFQVDWADPNTPFRLMRKQIVVSYLKSVPDNCQMLNLELLLRAYLDYKDCMLQIPVPYRKRSYGKRKKSNWTLFTSGIKTALEIYSLKKSHSKDSVPNSTSEIVKI